MSLFRIIATQQLSVSAGENLLLVPVGWDGIGWTVGTGVPTAQNIVQRPPASNVTSMYYLFQYSLHGRRKR